MSDSHRPKLWAPLAIVVASAAAMGGTRLADPDLGFHLATGREVLATGQIPATNVLSFTQSDHPWILHEWLPAALFELVNQTAGAPGLVLLQMALLVACWALVFLAARRESGTDWPAAVATLLALAAAGSRVSLRPHLFTALFLAALLFLTTRTDRLDARWRVALAIGAVIFVGYQVHAGALFLVLFAGAVVVGRFVDARFRERPDGSWLEVGAAAAGAVCLAAAALTIYHPHGADVLVVPFQLAGSAELTQRVIEYRPIWEFGPARLPFFWLFLCVALPALIWGLRHAPLRLVLAAAGMLFMAVRHVRVIDSAAIVAAPLLALALSALLVRASPSWHRLMPAFAVALGVCASVVRFSHTAPGATFDESVFATRLFDWADSRGIEGRAYLTNGWGGPYLARYYPERRVFFDPRFEAYSPEFVGVYQEIRYGGKGWARHLDTFEVEVAILKYSSATERARQDGPNIRQLLVASPAWMLVYFDDDGEIFVRVAGPNAAVARAEGIPGVEPDRIQFLGDPGAALPHLQRALDRQGPSRRLLETLADSAKAAGQLDLAGEYESRTH